MKGVKYSIGDYVYTLPSYTIGYIDLLVDSSGRNMIYRVITLHKSVYVSINDLMPYVTTKK